MTDFSEVVISADKARRMTKEARRNIQDGLFVTVWRKIEEAAENGKDHCEVQAPSELPTDQVEEIMQGLKEQGYKAKMSSTNLRAWVIRW